MLRSIFPAVLLLAAPAAAQDTPTPAPAATPVPAATPPVVIPTPTPTPDVSEPATTPDVADAPVATPSPRSAPSPTASPTPEAEADPVEDLVVPPFENAIAPVETTPTPEATPEPQGEVTTSVSPDRGDEGGGGGWLLLAGVGLMIVAAVLVVRALMPRPRRVRDDLDAQAEPVASPMPVPSAAPSPASSRAPTPAPAAPVPARAVAVPTIDFHPSRLGLNLVSVTASGEVVLGNEGSEPMADIQVRAALLAAAAGHEASVAGLHRLPTGRLAAPPFALAPGETRRIRLIVAAGRNDIVPLDVAGRPMMVPLVAITFDWRDGAGEHRRTQAFAVGIERVDSPKLAPVWLDQDSRTFDTVAARPHGTLLT